MPEGPCGGGAEGSGLHDGALQSEIELVGDLVVAATESQGPLPPAEVDRVLGVPPAGTGRDDRGRDDRGRDGTGRDDTGAALAGRVPPSRCGGPPPG